MDEDKLKNFMSFNEKGKLIEPLFVHKVNEKFIIAVYQGFLSKYDIRIKYRQKNKNSWSRIRTPKHIHWAVDVLIKMHFEPNKTKEFLEFLLKLWDQVEPLKSDEERKKILNIDYLIENIKNEFKQYEMLSHKGEYSIKFLILLAQLLMIQEKTNFEGAYMFKELLKALKKGEDIFKIVSIASHTGRR